MNGDGGPLTDWSDHDALQKELARIQERAVRARRHGTNPDDGHVSGAFARFFDRDVPALLGLVEELARRAGAERSPADRRRLDDVLAESAQLHGQLAECRSARERAEQRAAAAEGRLRETQTGSTQ